MGNWLHCSLNKIIMNPPLALAYSTVPQMCWCEHRAWHRAARVGTSRESCQCPSPAEFASWFWSVVICLNKASWSGEPFSGMRKVSVCKEPSMVQWHQPGCEARGQRQTNSFSKQLLAGVLADWTKYVLRNEIRGLLQYVYEKTQHIVCSN